MSPNEPPKAPEDKEIQIPEWENAAVNNNTRSKGTGARHSTKGGLSNRFNSTLPPHRRYFGLSRKVFLLVLLAIVLALLALIIGLAVGLTGHSR